MFDHFAERDYRDARRYEIAREKQLRLLALEPSKAQHPDYQNHPTLVFWRDFTMSCYVPPRTHGLAKPSGE